MEPNDAPRASNFLREIIAADVASGRYDGRVATRFPPEPNGYPHIGHAQSICLNFGLAREFGGITYLRYDDTNPETENPEFVAALEDAVRWLGFDPYEIRFASDYFEQFYAWAVDLVKRGLAYVDSQSEEAIREGRGTVTEPGTPSPYRDRPVEENLRLLDAMRRGEHPDGSHVLRAKIDAPGHGAMAHPNMKLRDPLMYRIRRDAHHYRRGTDWAIYPLYDWAHGQGDAIEGITHSVCTLEFDVNRPLYDWYLDAIGIREPRNHQYEFARFNLDYTVTSKRKLRQLVEDGHVSGWDDPRMPTIAGLRRRGVRPEALRTFFDGIGITKVNGSIELQQFEHALRDDLNAVAPRVLAVTDPVRLTIEGVEETTWTDAPSWPHDVTPPADAPATRRLPVSGSVWIEREDFADDPPKGWKRLAPGARVRLRHGPVVECLGAEHDAEGRVTAVRARLADAEGKVNGVIHWVDAAHALPATFRLYDRLFTVPDPAAAEDFLGTVNPDSFVVRRGYVEPSVADDAPDARYQFERLGYFWQDPEDSRPDALVFNRIVALKDTWGKRTATEPAPAKTEGRGTTDDRPAGAAPPPPSPSAPRDPAAGLTDDQRAAYDALVGRGVGEEEAAVLAGDTELALLLDDILGLHDAPRDAAVLLVHDLRPALGEAGLAGSNAMAQALADVLRLLAEGTITRQAASEIVGVLHRDGGAAQAVVEARGLAAVRDDATLAPIIDQVLTDHPEEVARYRAGEQKLMGFFIGQAMRRVGKGADAQAVQALLRAKLAG